MNKIQKIRNGFKQEERVEVLGLMLLLLRHNICPQKRRRNKKSTKFRQAIPIWQLVTSKILSLFLIVISVIKISNYLRRIARDTKNISEILHQSLVQQSMVPLW